MRINAEAIGKRMEEKGISQLEMCRRIDVTPVYFGVVMHRQEAPAHVAEPIAEVLGCTLEEITGRYPPAETEKTVKLNSGYILELLRSKGMSMETLAWMVGVSRLRMKRELDKGEMEARHAARVADMLNVPIVEITLGS